MSDELLTTKQAAEILNVLPEHIGRLTATGALPRNLTTSAVYEYAEKRKQERREAAAEATAEARELGLYDDTDDIKQEFEVRFRGHERWHLVTAQTPEQAAKKARHLYVGCLKHAVVEVKDHGFYLIKRIPERWEVTPL